MVQKIYSKMCLVSCTNTHHDITDLVNHRMAKNTKTWISWKRNIIVLWNKKILNLYLRWHILRSRRGHPGVNLNFEGDSFLLEKPGTIYSLAQSDEKICHKKWQVWFPRFPYVFPNKKFLPYYTYLIYSEYTAYFSSKFLTSRLKK